MVLTHGNVIFDILEPPAFQKYSICWVFQAFFCSTVFYMYFAAQPSPSLTAVSEHVELTQKCLPGPRMEVKAHVAHCCTIFLCYLDLEINDKYGNPNYIREVI